MRGGMAFTEQTRFHLPHGPRLRPLIDLAAAPPQAFTQTPGWILTGSVGVLGCGPQARDYFIADLLLASVWHRIRNVWNAWSTGAHPATRGVACSLKLPHFVNSYTLRKTARFAQFFHCLVQFLFSLLRAFLEPFSPSALFGGDTLPSRRGRPRWHEHILIRAWLRRGRWRSNQSPILVEQLRRTQPTRAVDVRMWRQRPLPTRTALLAFLVLDLQAVPANALAAVDAPTAQQRLARRDGDGYGLRLNARTVAVMTGSIAVHITTIRSADQRLQLGPIGMLPNSASKRSFASDAI